MNLIDIGANLTHDAFAPDLDDVVARATAAGVAQMIVTGSTVDESARAVALAETRPGVLHATVGVHPHHADELADTGLAELRRLATREVVKALGEMGLDFYRDLSPREAQERAFESQLDLAVDLKMPVFLHERDAHERFQPILQAHRSRLTGVVVHCFTGDRRALADYLDLDCHIGITGWVCDERRGKHVLDLVGSIPPDRLMVETDAPYLLPRTIRPKPKARRNEPSYLPHVVNTIAAACGRDPQQVADQTTAVAQRFFKLAQER